MNNNQVHEEYKKLGEKMSQLNTQRGGSADGLKGFYAELANSTENNVEKIEKGIAAREEVIDNNGPADAVIKYKNGSLGREKQYKSGYSFPQHKKNIESGKYDNQIYSINKDNPILNNPKELETLKSLAKKHNIKIEVSKVPDSEMKVVAKAAQLEGKIRNEVGLDQTAPITSNVYSGTKELMHSAQNLNNDVQNINNTVISQAGEVISSIQNGSKEFVCGVSDALENSVIPLMIVGTQDLIKLAKGEMTMKEAVEDVGGVGLKIAVTGGSMRVASYALSGFIEQSSNTMLKAIAKSNQIGTVIVVGTIIARATSKYVSGEIDGEQFFEEISSEGLSLVVGIVGGAIGGPIGTVIASTACSIMVSSIHSLKQSYKSIDRMQSQYLMTLDRISNRMINEIKESRERLKKVYIDEKKKWDKSVEMGFDMIISGTLNNSMEEISKGINSIMKLFGAEVEFMNASDVRNFMNQSKRVFEL